MLLNADRHLLRMFTRLDVSFKNPKHELFFVVKSIISTFNDMIGDEDSTHETLNKLSTNFDQMIEQMGVDIDEKTKMKIEKAKIAVSSLVDFTLEGK